MEIRNSLTGNTAKKSVHDLCTNVVKMLGMFRGMVTRLKTPLWPRTRYGPKSGLSS